MNYKYEIRYLKTNTLYIRTAAEVEVMFAFSENVYCNSKTLSIIIIKYSSIGLSYKANQIKYIKSYGYYL